MENRMLTLHLPAEPYWLDLPRGVRVRIKPVTTAVMAAAQAAASRRLGAVRADAGAEGIDPDMAKGLAFAFLVKALARHSVVAWEGVGDRHGAPLDPTPENVERLMDIDDVAAAFWDGATAPVAAVAAEGNGSGPPRRVALRTRARVLRRLRGPISPLTKSAWLDSVGLG
jgi:hypothetical protein